MNQQVDKSASRIAERGREELIGRLRPAFEKAAAAHADILELDEERLEELIQRAADRADGVQWRRALASVASEQLGISLSEALHHPAVARAQELVGAPSYEDSLAAVGQSRPSNGASGASLNEEAHVDEKSDDDPESGDVEAERGDEEPKDAEIEDIDDYEDEYEPAEEDASSVRLPAIHLNGIANLDSGESGLELLFADQGLDIIRGSNAILGRLNWAELRAIEVPPPSGRWRRRRRGSAQLVIRAEHGDATFAIPDMDFEELRVRVSSVATRLSEE